MEFYMEKFAERLKELREEKGLSYVKLAQKIGVSDVTIGRWEKLTSVPSATEIIALSKFFGVSADYLLGLED
jgi:transcriptional regulator with XRE-family HTH domain